MVLTEMMGSLAAGVVLGALYLAALWFTVQRVAMVRQPALWLSFSAALRVLLLLAGFYWVGDGQWQRLIACLAGFVVARVLATNWPRLRRTARALLP
jgi:F1F0 ATPase subunit 2